jgi:hypothetical protein
MRTAPVILGREGPDADDPEAVRRRAAEERSERLRFSLPLLVLAGASLLVSYVLFHEALAPHASRVPLWVLAFSVGVIASAGGSASLLVGDFSGDAWLTEARASPEYVVVQRNEWVALQEKLREGIGSPGATATGPPFELPVWEEPAESRPPSEVPAPAADMSPPAPMSVSHGLDSLATEVERLVADLESAATASARAPPAPVTAAPTPVEVAAPSAPPPAAAGISPAPPPQPAFPSWVASSPPAPIASQAPPRRPAAPATSPNPPAPRPTERAKVSPPSPPALPAADDAEVEYRMLLAELERRAQKASGRPTVALPSAPTVAGDVRCVGCDARLGPNDPGEPCRSCRSPMCPSCRDRSAKEGYRGLCAVCSILAESEGRGANSGR